MSSQNEVSSLDEVTPADCNKWFHCFGCGWDYQDPHAEIHGGDLVGMCECGATHTKSVRDAYNGEITVERRQNENQQLTEFKG